MIRGQGDRHYILNLPQKTLGYAKYFLGLTTTRSLIILNKIRDVGVTTTKSSQTPLPLGTKLNHEERAYIN